MKNNWKSCLIAMAALIAVATIHAQSSGTYTGYNFTANGTVTGFGTGGSGTYRATITDLKATRTSSTVLTFNAGVCWGVEKSGTLTATIAAGSGSGSWVAYCTDSGAIVVEHSTAAGLTVNGSGVTTAQVTTPAVPEGMRPIASGNLTSGTWNSTVNDTRDIQNTRHTDGTGMDVECSGGVCVHQVDSAAVQLKTDTYAPTGRLDGTGATSTAPVKTGTSIPGTCTVGDQFFKTDAAAGQNLYGCTATNTYTVLSGSSYEPIDRTQILLLDEFASGETTGLYGTIGQLGWRYANIVGSGGNSSLAGDGAHIGIHRISSGTSTNDELTLELYQSRSQWNDKTFDLTWVVKIPTATSMRAAVGLIDSLQGAGATHRIAAKYDTSSSDTVWKFQACASGTCTTDSSTVGLTVGSWYRIRIRSTTAGTILFSVNGETEVPITGANVPSAGTLGPVASITTRTGAARDLDIDWMGLRLTGLSR